MAMSRSPNWRFIFKQIYMLVKGLLAFCFLAVFLFQEFLTHSIISFLVFLLFRGQFSSYWSDIKPQLITIFNFINNCWKKLSKLLT